MHSESQTQGHIPDKTLTDQTHPAQPQNMTVSARLKAVMDAYNRQRLEYEAQVAANQRHSSGSKDETTSKSRDKSSTDARKTAKKGPSKDARLNIILQPANELQIRAASNILEEIIHDKLPIYVIDLSERKITPRSEVWKAVRDIVLLQVDSRPWEQQRTQIEGVISKSIAYAILSHRWLPHGEIAFHEWWEDQYLLYRGVHAHVSPAGLDKVNNFTQVALEMGYKWAWMDTCCIDKRSSAEVEESIRSMYRWYRNAAVCVVHLHQTHTLDDMPRDEWFRRGWTLQELLAPSRLKFYNTKWQPLRGGSYDIEKMSVGDIGIEDVDDELQPADSPVSRTTLVAGSTIFKNAGPDTTAGPVPSKGCTANAFVRMISQITKISILDLRSFDASLGGIRKKMIWASSRKTTRVEDRAYSLIGIFNVSMSIAYGEGELAFYRLQKAILKQQPNPEIFAWQGECSAAHSMFAKSPECFVPLDWKCHLEKTLTRLYERSPEFVAYGSNQMAQNLTPRGSAKIETSGIGLSIHLVVYNVAAVEKDQDGGFHWRLHVEGGIRGAASGTDRGVSCRCPQEEDLALDDYNLDVNDDEHDSSRESASSGRYNLANWTERHPQAILKFNVQLLRTWLTKVFGGLFRNRQRAPYAASNGYVPQEPEPLAIVQVKSKIADFQLHQVNCARKLRLGIIDYEWDEAHGEKYVFRDELYDDGVNDPVPIPKNQKKFTRDILKGRRERLYTAILLYRHFPGRNRPFVKIETEEIIQVYRPTTGWKRPEEVYIR